VLCRLEFDGTGGEWFWANAAPWTTMRRQNGRPAPLRRQCFMPTPSAIRKIAFLGDYRSRNDALTTEPENNDFKPMMSNARARIRT
jgi:hypothetical protein